MLISGALMMVAKAALTAVVGPFVEDAREAAMNAASDTLHSVIAGQIPLAEWAALAGQSADQVKQRAVLEGELQFVGGKLKFALSEQGAAWVTISFALYFLDKNRKWQLASAAIDVPASKFEPETLEELRTQGEILYELE